MKTVQSPAMAAAARRCFAFALAWAVVLAGGPGLAWPQEAATDEAPATVEAPAATSNAAPAAAAAAESEQPVATIGAAGAAEVGVDDVLSFRQAKVAAEMTELEDRMFRLSEALKEMEPESSSRLMLGLKFAREELILHQMKEAQKLLDGLSLADAAIEEKELLGKLQRLHDLLLSTDLDFQMRLEQLRQIREILRRLDKAIEEEDRELGLSSDAAAKQQRLEGLKKKRATLEELIQRQTAHLVQGRSLAAVESPGEAESETAAALSGEQQQTQTATRNLAAEEAVAEGQPRHLDDADARMGEAVGKLDESAAGEAVPPQEQALAALERERDRTAAEQQQAEDDLAAADFERMRRDQEQNRELNQGIEQLTRKLGERGAGAMTELTRATGSMSGAESDLGQQAAGEAGEDQGQALASLKYAREQLEEQAQKLLDELRAEVRKRVLEGLTVMLERQIAVREATETLGPRAAGGSRQALTSLVSLGKSEGRIVELANELLTLVEETEFGIALPAALLVVRDAMEDVQDRLAAGDGSVEVVVAEQQIEADLQSLLEAMKQMPSQRPPRNRPPQQGQRDRERELNRLIAELKIIRMLQVRVNRNTEDVDGRRPPDLDAVSAALTRQIEELTDRQDSILNATERLLEERGDELEGGSQ